MPRDWEYSVLTFLDVLGFASFVETDARALAPTHLDRLLDALEEARNATPAVNLDIRSFSDSIILSGPLSQDGIVDSLAAIAGLQRIFVRHGVLVRGAITFGKHYADERSIYSQALVKAYNMERLHARYPRVIVDADLVDWFVHDTRTDDAMRSTVRAMLLRDRDNHIFVNYLSADSLQSHRDLVQSYNNLSANASVLEKVQWLAEYHNYVAEKVTPDAKVSGALLRGFTVL